MSATKTSEVPAYSTKVLAHTHPHCSRSSTLCEESRRERVFDAAENILQRYGYRCASMDKIARHSGMSKKTLYAMFSSKQEMIEQLLHERLMLKDLQTLKLKGNSVESQLIFGLKTLRSELLKKKRLSLLRLVIGESSRSHEADQIVRDFFSGASEAFPLKKWLERLKDEGQLNIVDIESACDMLFGFALASELLSELLHCCPNPPNRDRTSYLSATVEAFLRLAHPGQPTQKVAQE